MSIAGIIIAGGAGSRIGGDKPLQRFAGATLIDAVIARARPQVDGLALNVPRARQAQYRAHFEGPLLCDETPERWGPLAGILAGLVWLQRRGDAGWLASFPGDTPFLPRDLVARLSVACQPGRPAVIKRGGQIEALCALWPLQGLAPLREAVQSGALQSVRAALAALDAVYVEAPDPASAFFNVNTAADLAEAERLAAEL